MQVMLFIGEDFYPRPNLGDFVKVMPSFPTDEELLADVITLMTTQDRFGVHAQWATAMALDPVTNEPKMVHWIIDYATDEGKLQKLGSKGICSDGNNGWYGVRNEEVEWND